MKEDEYNLINAVMNGTMSSVKRYINKCDINKVGILALRQSLGWDDLEIANFLIKKGAPAASTLYHCANDGSSFEIERLFSINKFSTTELAQACGIAIIKNHEKTVTQLFKHEPELRMHGNYFYKTAKKENPEMLNFLLENEYCKEPENQEVKVISKASKMLH